MSANIDLMTVWNKCADEHHISDFLTDKEIKQLGYKKVSAPIFEIQGEEFVVCTRSLTHIMPEAEFDAKAKRKAINALKKLGFTHIYELKLHRFPYYFNLETCKADPAVRVIARGCTVKKCS